MGFTGKSSSKSNREGWGMGFFLVFFPEEDTMANDSKLPTHQFSQSSCHSFLRRTNSTNLFTKAQSTISICALLIFITFLLFTLSTFDPTPTPTTHFTSRRHLSSNSQFAKKPTKRSAWPLNFLAPSFPKPKAKPPVTHALQGMGTLYRRGTFAMNDLLVCHVTESVTLQELRLFLRVLHRSGLTSKSDVVFVFPSSTSGSYNSAILEENDSFLKLVQKYHDDVNGSGSNDTSLDSVASFDVTQFVKASKKEKERGETLWGRKFRSNSSGDGEAELTRLSYGSVVSFEVDELDPENTLGGFLDHVPMSLRRWASYPMLLGRLRRNFKHVMLVDVKDVLLLGDPLGRVRNRSPESVWLSTPVQPTPSKHGRKNSVNSAVIMGGNRGVRRLSSAMLTEIVRAAVQKLKAETVMISDIGFDRLKMVGYVVKEFHGYNTDLLLLNI
ncbi:hypothetical protein RJ640_010813 [Escallonia rubra]|uniref:DUF7780 domain-containing protein n=1 Tax=Escallonia rubra TaxID=112253 RepID=A0AA88UAG4_9ASTE|nr:hypothetical protein RJ640_010813 [Escallonia rubra]